MFILSCNNENSTIETTTIPEPGFINEHTSKNSLDWHGTYESVIPCADCPGIKVHINLHDNHRFEKTYTYLERNTTDHYAGDILWSEDGNTISLIDGDFKTMYKVGEGKLIQLDTEGNEITGNLQDAYILRKL